MREYDSDSYIDNELEKIKKEKELLRKMKIELFVKKIEPYISGASRKGLHNLFLDSLLNKVDNLNYILEKYEKKLKNKKVTPEKKYIYEKDYKYKKVKKRTRVDEEENDSKTSESEEEKDKIRKTAKKYY